MHAPRRRAQVLVLGGWSPGPLPALAHAFGGHCDFHDITPSLHTPPCGLRWCCNPWLVALIAYVAGAVPYMIGQMWNEAGTEILPHPAIQVGLTLVLLAISAVLCRALVAGLVRYAVARGVDAAARAINTRGIDVVVGFSWGGGLLCWLLAERRWQGPSLLLAPTVSAMCRAAWIAKRFKPRFDVAPARATAVHVFHGRHDGFCPEAQVARLSGSGATMHDPIDDHVLCHPETREEIARAMRGALRAAADAARARRAAGGGAVYDDDEEGGRRRGVRDQLVMS